MLSPNKNNSEGAIWSKCLGSTDQIIRYAVDSEKFNFGVNRLVTGRSRISNPEESVFWKLNPGSSRLEQTLKKTAAGIFAEEKRQPGRF